MSESGYKKALKEVQGNILKPFNKDHQRLLFFRFDVPDKAGNWLAELTSSEPSRDDTKMILPSTEKVMETAARIDSGEGVRQTWLHISLSYMGLTKLGRIPPFSAKIYQGLEELPINPAPGTEDPTEDPFKIGMQNRRRDLGDEYDSHPKNWKKLYRGKPEDPKDLDEGRYQHTEVDAVFIVASDLHDDVLGNSQRLKNSARRNGAFFLGEEIGKMIYENGEVIEHFGFRDGLSDPLIQGVDKKKINNRTVYPDVFEYYNFVLTGMEALDEKYKWANNGSFLVFRKLVQDVYEFWNFMNNQYPGRAANADELAAKFFGRRKDGTPLVPNANQLKSPNDFLYKNDPLGEYTPKFSHIRKCNPRDENSGGLQETNFHRILRRGITYGDRWRPGVEADRKKKRGLLFICYQRDIVEQFEYIQKRWMNMSSFPQSQLDVEKPGPDPIAGMHHVRNGQVTLKVEGRPSQKIPIAQWVKTVGGGYYFSPSISALKKLKRRQ